MSNTVCKFTRACVIMCSVWFATFHTFILGTFYTVYLLLLAGFQLAKVQRRAPLGTNGSGVISTTRNHFPYIYSWYIFTRCICCY